jgi:hypothetical protein
MNRIKQMSHGMDVAFYERLATVFAYYGAIMATARFWLVPAFAWVDQHHPQAHEYAVWAMVLLLSLVGAVLLARTLAAPAPTLQQPARYPEVVRPFRN